MVVNDLQGFYLQLGGTPHGNIKGNTVISELKQEHYTYLTGPSLDIDARTSGVAGILTRSACSVPLLKVSIIQTTLCS